MLKFNNNNFNLKNEYSSICWIEDSGIDEKELLRLSNQIIRDTSLAKCIRKTKVFELIASKSRIAIDKDDIFQEKLYGAGLLSNLRCDWMNAIQEKYLEEECRKVRDSSLKYGSYEAHCDFGHISPNTELLLKIGFTGLLDRINMYAKKNGLTQKQKDFYESCTITLKSIIKVALRLSEAIKPYNIENSIALYNIASGAPSNIYEAMQTLILYFFLHEYVAGARVRTLGRLDVLLSPFYKKDIEEGRFSKDIVAEMLKYFLNKFWVANVPYNLPFALGGMDVNGNDVTNEFSYLVIETYNTLNIYSPKIHIRVSNGTPIEFIKLVLSCVRRGNSSFVFVNDNVAVQSLINVGITVDDARNYVPIGCYEPAVWGKEIGCTGNGFVNLAKAIELAFTNGRDYFSGDLIGCETAQINSFDDFKAAVKMQIAHLTDAALSHITKLEKYYGEMYSDPILSSMYDESVEKGMDVYEGGAKYNNSSMNFIGLATLTDSICAVKKLVFDDKKLSLYELRQILESNWSGYEQYLLEAKNNCEKYGNGQRFADSIATEFADYIAEITNNRKNGREGVFKAALFSIDTCFRFGKNTMATPDGRRHGDPISKNLGASFGMDKNGITALINSVTKIDMSKFPNGSVLDIVLHPSSVSGEDGLDAFYGLLKVYFDKGGFAIHGNIFNLSDLIEAQKNPEKYKTLQVRVCGWNAYFVDLSSAEQEAFILQAQNTQ